MASEDHSACYSVCSRKKKILKQRLPVIHM